MCGRYTLKTSAEEIAALFEIEPEDVPDLSPRYNVAPTQDVPIVRVAGEGGRREVALVRWGLVPWFAREPKAGARCVNARAESIFEKPAFRGPAERRRCLVPADGFYEWRAEGKRKQPFYFRLRNGGLFAFAGLWERSRPKEGRDDPPVESCAILTCDANEEVRPVHDRMPVILPPERFALWLDPAVRSPEALRPLLWPCPAGALEAIPVGPHVNRPEHDDPRCVVPLDRVHFDGDGTLPLFGPDRGK